MDNSKIDGRRFFYYFYAGAMRLLEHQQEINKLNVFPVPDADTGTNLASTFRSIMDAIRPMRSYKMTTSQIAEAALTGARGNSGIIFAQFLSGLDQETCECNAISIKDFALSVKNSIRYLYEAIANPVEGTMLTVIREWAEYINQYHGIEDFRTLMINSYEEARRSMLATSKRIKELTSTAVVDAGAKGFVVFLEGVVDLLKSNDIRHLVRMEKPVVVDDIDIDIDHGGKLTYRYCTEVLLKGKDINRLQLEKMLEGYGDSIVVAGTSSIVRMHVHTDQPDKVIDNLRSHGKLVFQKADDMLLQYRVAHERKYRIALVTDSASDLPEDFLEEHQITMVPIYLYMDENQYLDRVTIRPERFYEIIDAEQPELTTSQPNIKSFVNLYSRLASHYDSVIAVHLSSVLSGTFRTSQQAAEQVSRETGKRITVLDSKGLSGMFGLVVKRVAEAIEAGLSHDEILARYDHWVEKARVYAVVGSMKQLVRSGRISHMKGWFGRLLHLRPLVTIDRDGKAITNGMAFSQKKGLRKIIRILASDKEFARTGEYLVMHANTPRAAEALGRQIEKITGKRPAGYYSISPVLGLHLGAGSIGVAYMEE
jgi:DegV family protein with EDD domain